MRSGHHVQPRKRDQRERRRDRLKCCCRLIAQVISVALYVIYAPCIFLQFKGSYLRIHHLQIDVYRVWWWLMIIHTGYSCRRNGTHPYLVRIQIKYEHIRTRIHTCVHAFASILSRWTSACIHVRIRNESRLCLYFYPACLIPSSCLACDFKRLISS